MCNYSPKTLLGFITALFIAASMVACESNIAKGTEAFDNAKEARTTQDDSLAISTQADAMESNLKTSKPDKPSAKNNVVVVDSWTHFKNAMDLRIKSNENTIDALQGQNGNAKQAKKVAMLEKENLNLKAQMDRYREEEKQRWEKFSSAMNRDVDAITAELIELKNSTKE